MIKTEDLYVSFGNGDILKGVSAEIPKNKITAIVGQSGTGKSVFVKTIDGLIKPWKGSIKIDGEEVLNYSKSEWKELRKRISFLFQSAGLFDSMDVLQNVSLPLREHTDFSMEKIRKTAKEKLALVGLPGIEEKYPSELSGGMKKRVGLARALVLEPEYIIYDEPTAGLDPLTANEITELIAEMDAHTDATSVVVTHDLDCLNKIAENIIMLKDGQVLYRGAYRDFIKNKNKDIQEFLTKYRTNI